MVSVQSAWFVLEHFDIFYSVEFNKNMTVTTSSTIAEHFVVGERSSFFVQFSYVVTSLKSRWTPWSKMAAIRRNTETVKLRGLLSRIISVQDTISYTVELGYTGFLRTANLSDISEIRYIRKKFCFVIFGPKSLSDISEFYFTKIAIPTLLSSGLNWTLNVVGSPGPTLEPTSCGLMILK